jgi:hypothetical protein
MTLPGTHTAVPSDPGESAIARALLGASAGRWHLWFNLQRNNNEMDDLVLAPEVGCFCIEVKNWKLSSLSEYSDDYVVTGSGRHTHPLKQAQIAMHGLMSHLDERGISKADKPFFYATAAFPQIRRDEMYVACGEEFARHFEGMIFAEDITGPDVLAGRLVQIGQEPPLGAVRRRQTPRPNQVEAVLRILNRKVVLQHRELPRGMSAVFQTIHDSATRAERPARSDAAGVRGTEERRQALQRPGTSVKDGVSRVVFHGKAGTGKTTELLKIALAHALSGRLTLVCCYTKVLAAELRSRMAALPGFADAGNNLLVVDLGQLGSVSDDAVGVAGFQTICVDESQDVAQDKFEALLELAAPDAEWFLADAPEQAIYDQRSAFVDAAVEVAKRNGTWEAKRVNLRSGIAERLICDAALEIAPHVSKIDGWVQEHPVKTGRMHPDALQGELDVQVAPEVAGHLPEIAKLPTGTGWDRRVEAYAELIRAEIKRQTRQRAKLDLAIASVRVDDMKDEWKKVKAALESLGVPYLDQVETANRRRSPASGEVRLSSIHSIRGVDAERVILLDLEGMEVMQEQDRPALLNIALSRARSGTVVAIRPMEARQGSHRAFVEQLVAAYAASSTG